MMSVRSCVTRAAVFGKAPMAVRPLSTTSTLALKESSRETEIDYEHHKKESLENQKKGKATWKRELASDSEEAVYAERNHGHEDIATMQKRTKESAEKTKE